MAKNTSALERTYRQLQRTYGTKKLDPDFFECIFTVVLACAMPFDDAKELYATIQKDCVDLNEFRVTRIHDIIARYGFEGAESEFMRVLEIFNGIFEEQGVIESAFYKDMDPALVKGILSKQKSLSKTERDYILSVCYGMKSTPVDRDIVLIMRRRKVFTGTINVQTVKKKVARAFSQSRRLQLFLLAREHCRECCREKEPDCDGCPVSRSCSHPNERVKKK